MKLSAFACRKFRDLTVDTEDRPLSARQREFVRRHRAACEPCRRTEQSATLALNMLRAATLEPEVGPQFDERVVRLARVQAVRAGLLYWSPAMMGAGAACLALLAAFQMISRPADLKPLSLPTAEARRLVEPQNEFKFKLELDRNTPILR